MSNPDLPELRKAWATDDRKLVTHCVNCDGCGWREGGDGDALGAACAVCNGFGVVNPPPSEGTET